MSKSLKIKLSVFLILSVCVLVSLVLQLKNNETAVVITLCGGKAQNFDYFSSDFRYSQRAHYPGGSYFTSVWFKPDDAKAQMGHRFDFGGIPGETFLISSIVLKTPGFSKYVLDLKKADQWIKRLNQLKKPIILDRNLLIETTGDDGFLVTEDDLFEKYAQKELDLSGKKIACAAVIEVLLLVFLLLFPWLAKGAIALRNKLTRTFLIQFGIFAAANLFIILPAGYLYYRNLPDVFSITLKAEKTFSLEIFYKSPYSEKFKKSITYSDENQYQTLSLSLPQDSSSDQIRIDFGGVSQTIHVKDISITRFGLFRSSVNLSQAPAIYTHRQDIDQFCYKKGLLCISVSGNDPHIIPSSAEFSNNRHIAFNFLQLLIVLSELFLLFACIIAQRFWNKNSWDLKRNILNSLLSAFIFVTSIFAIIPCQTLMAYQTDFQCSVLELIHSILPFAVLMFLLLSIALFVLQRIFSYIPHLLLLGLLLYEYLETGILSIGLPELNGNLSGYSVPSRIIWDTAVLIILLAIPLIWSRRLKKYIHWISLGILVMVMAASMEVKKSSLVTAKTGMIVPNTMSRNKVVASVRYSAENNVMLFIIDSVTVEVMQDVLEHNKDIARLYDGFVDYTNNVGMHIQTMVGVPGIMTGKYFEDPNDIASYSTSSFGPDSFIKPYYESKIPVYINLGLSLDSGFTNYPLSSNINAERKASTTPLKKRIQGMLIWSLEELSWFRLTPYCLKKEVLARIMHNWPNDSFQGNVSNDSFLYNKLAEKTVDTTKKMILNVHHTFASHPPFAFKANGEKQTITDASYNTYYEQTCYIARLLGELLAKYKKMGIYDKATIIILADHGINFVKTQKKIQSSAFPCLMVKPAGSREPLCFSNLSTSHSKIADLVKTLKDKTLSRVEIEKILHSEKRLYREGKDGYLSDWWVDPNGEVTFSKYRIKTRDRNELSVLEDGKKYSFRSYNNPDYPDFLSRNMARTGGRGIDLNTAPASMTLRVAKANTLYNLKFNVFSFSNHKNDFTGKFFFGTDCFNFKPYETRDISVTVQSDGKGFIDLSVNGSSANYALGLLSLVITEKQKMER